MCVPEGGKTEGSRPRVERVCAEIFKRRPTVRGWLLGPREGVSTLQFVQFAMRRVMAELERSEHRAREREGEGKDEAEKSLGGRAQLEDILPGTFDTQSSIQVDNSRSFFIF